MLKKIHFITYPKSSVLKYREAFISELACDYAVKLINPIEYFWNNADLVVSSNTLSNIFSLLFVFSKRLIILNGLGRNYKYRAWRLLFIILLKAQNNRRCIVVSQNYRDYRYLRRFGLVTEFIMGSGGRSFETGEKTKCIVVTREKKLKSQIDAIEQFLDKHPKLNIDIYGMQSASHGFEHRVRFNGFVESKKLFINANIVYHPAGYGDGFPHSLADAICSDIDILLHKRSYIEYGLYLIADSEFFSDGYVLISPSAEKNFYLKTRVQLPQINEKYMSLVHCLLGEIAAT